MRRKTMVAAAMALLLVFAVGAAAENFRSIKDSAVKCTDGTTSTQTFGWSSRTAGFEVAGKSGAYFWLRWKVAGTWRSVPVYANSAYYRTGADSVEITPATADTIYVIGYEG